MTDYRKLSEYSAHITNHACYPNVGQNIAYAAFGMISELGEYFDKPSVSELGDCLWNLNQLCYEGTLKVYPEDPTRLFIDYLREAENEAHSQQYREEFLDFLAKKANWFDQGFTWVATLFLRQKAEKLNNRLADLSSKVVRKHNGNVQADRKYQDKLNALIQEYAILIVQLAKHHLKEPLEALAEANTIKLDGRAEAGTLKGSGEGIQREA